LFDGLETAKLKVKFVIGVRAQFGRRDFDNSQSPLHLAARFGKFERFGLDDVFISRFGIAKYDHAVNVVHSTASRVAYGEDSLTFALGFRDSFVSASHGTSSIFLNQCQDSFGGDRIPEVVSMPV